MRVGPSTTAPQIHLLPFGTAITILGLDTPQWAHVRLADGTEGYVSTYFLREPQP